MTPGRIFFRAPESSAASFFPFSRSALRFVGRFRGADLPDDRGDVLGLCAGEDLLETEEGRDGEDVQFESDGGEGDVLLGEVGGHLFRARDPAHVGKGRLLDGPLEDPADEVDRLPFRGDDQDPLLDRPGEVEKIGVLHEERGVEVSGAQARLQLRDPRVDLLRRRQRVHGYFFDSCQIFSSSWYDLGKSAWKRR